MKSFYFLVLCLFCFLSFSCKENKSSSTIEPIDIETNTALEKEISQTQIDTIFVNINTLEELFSKKESYSEKNLIIKGKVTKINNGIMDRNWVHISDDTQFEDKKSLTVTTLDSVSMGDLVTFKGTLILNKDFGYGYVYDILLEDGKLIDHSPVEESSEK